MANYQKIIRLLQPDWSSLQPELVDWFVEKLSYAEKCRIQAVCTSWCSVAKTSVLSLIQTIKSQPPTLMHPSNQDSEVSTGRSFSNLENKLLQKIMDLPRELDDKECIGSSNGWLVLLDKKNEMYDLFNPFFIIDIKVTNLPLLKFTTKFALWSDPISGDGNNYAIVTIKREYEFSSYMSGLYYAMHCDKSWRPWSKLGDGAEASYCDIVCRKHLVYALSESGSVEAWDFRACIPAKEVIIPPNFSQESINISFLDFDKDLYRTRLYLIESNYEFFLVIRYVGYHVRDDGLVVSYIDKDADPEHNGFEFRYLTKFFHVFKADINKEQWVRVNSLGDGMVFLGKNESVMIKAGDLKGYEKNSIYFTDDSDMIDMDYDSGGHDMGIFDLESGSITSLLDSWRIEPVPLWVIPQSM